MRRGCPCCVVPRAAPSTWELESVLSATTADITTQCMPSIQSVCWQVRCPQWLVARLEQLLAQYYLHSSVRAFQSCAFPCDAAVWGLAPGHQQPFCCQHNSTSSTTSTAQHSASGASSMSTARGKAVTYEWLHMRAFSLAGKKPVRYNDAITPYARLVNHTERLWDYDSCAEAQLKIWLARHLIASENSGEGYRCAGWLCELHIQVQDICIQNSKKGSEHNRLQFLLHSNPKRVCTISQPWLPEPKWSGSTDCLPKLVRKN